LLTPALLLAAAGILARYHLDEALRPGVWTRATHFAFNIRWVAAPLPLLLVLRLVSQGLSWLMQEPSVGLIWVAAAVPAVAVLLEFVPLLVALALFPLLLRIVFPTAPLPNAWLRARLRALDEKVGVR